MTLEYETTSQQKPFRIRKSLRELVHKQQKPKSRRYSLTLPPLPPHDRETDEYAYDVLYECQRGSLAVGYSSKTLLQFDPNPWCDANMKFTPMNTENYQLPDPTWEWISKDWMIDMTEDVDEAGWQYAIKFHGADWHGNYKHFRSFVRRRRWIRLRHRSLLNRHSSMPTAKTRTLVNVEQTSASTIESITDVDQKEQELRKSLKKCRLDRERMSVLNAAFKSTLPGLENLLLEKAMEYLELFEYEDTKFKFLALLLIRKYGSNTKMLTLTEREKAAVKSLRFYYDIQLVLNKLAPTTSMSDSAASLLP